MVVIMTLGITLGTIHGVDITMATTIIIQITEAVIILAEATTQEVAELLLKREFIALEVTTQPLSDRAEAPLILAVELQETKYQILKTQLLIRIAVAEVLIQTKARRLITVQETEEL